MPTRTGSAGLCGGGAGRGTMPKMPYKRPCWRRCGRAAASAARVASARGSMRWPSMPAAARIGAASMTHISPRRTAGRGLADGGIYRPIARPRQQPGDAGTATPAGGARGADRGRDGAVAGALPDRGPAARPGRVVETRSGGGPLPLRSRHEVAASPGPHAPAARLGGVPGALSWQDASPGGTDSLATFRCKNQPSERDITRPPATEFWRIVHFGLDLLG